MRVIVISRSWPCYERSGVTFSAASHVISLHKMGHTILIVGSDVRIKHEQLPVEGKVYIYSSGTGALYSPSFVDKYSLNLTLSNFNPDVVIIEGWQHSLGAASIEISYKLRIPCILISHGISVHPFTPNLIDRIRAVGWLYYKIFQLPKLLGKVTLLTVLDETSNSSRFYDRLIARKLGKDILPLVNSPANWTEKYTPRNLRKNQVLIIGYFSRIKNQLELIKLINKFPAEIVFKFIGKKDGSYFKKCEKAVLNLGIKSRVHFLDDSECNISEEIADSLVVLNCSITEVLPLVLLEAMASATPFVAMHVGAIASLNSGIVVNKFSELLDATMNLISDEKLWLDRSRIGVLNFNEKYSDSIVYNQLYNAIQLIAVKEYD